MLVTAVNKGKLLEGYSVGTFVAERTMVPLQEFSLKLDKKEA